ncbi:GumC family protein [Methylocaldum sp.]|uniref:GumC family protein n=1 Tax=Methylocaldum sp. TaxID=1969727 RepID=UPI002D55DBC7|nr:polysaccharide biosynthesis tyrosine autokinase [Methylocaldum sp.]HYE35694.1 polysaccharide biosynthesis tyrosine autokinase [Methylocaldum sp.]
MDYPVQAKEKSASTFYFEQTSKDLALPRRSEDDEVDLRRYWDAVQNKKWSILGLALLTTVLVGFSVSSMNPVYRSTATLKIEHQQPKVLSFQEVYGVDNSSEYIETQIEMLKSRDLTYRVIDQLKLGERPEFAEWLGEPPLWRKWLSWLPNLIDSWLSTLSEQKDDEPLNEGKRDEALKEALTNTFLNYLKIEPRKNTQLVDVSFESRDPQLARQIVDSLGAAFIAKSVEERTEVTRMAAQWLEKRLQTLRNNYMESQKRLQDYLEKENLVDLSGVLTLTGRQAEDNTARLGNAQKARVEAESLYNKVRSLNDRLYDSIEGVPEISGDSGVHALKQKEAEILQKISEIADRYGSEHPSMVAARAELESIRASLRKQISSAVSGIKNRYEVARANELAALRDLEANKNQVQNIGAKQVRVQELEREVESNIRLYEMFFNRFKEASESADLHAANIYFVDRASHPTSPIKPKKILIIGMAFIGTLFIGVLLAVVRDIFDNTVKTAENIENNLAIPLLGVLPFFHKKSKRLLDDTVAKIVVDQPESDFAEAVRTIRTTLMLSGSDRSYNSWLLSSSLPGEGKSVIAINLAYSLARTNLGRILLIDADMRAPTLDKYMGLPPGSPGLANVLAGSVELAACIHPIAGFQLDVIPAGRISSSPLELLSSPNFGCLIGDLKKRYHAVLIDSPPMHDVSDAYLLAQHVSSVIYVVKAGETAIQLVKDALKRLDYFKTPLAGIVLNQAKDDKNRYYNYKYGQPRNRLISKIYS